MPSEDDVTKSPQMSHPLATDDAAASASPGMPGFLAKPTGAPVYHGFRILSDVVVEGFTFGAITDFETEAANEGDAFVIAPDGSRAGLVWEVSDAKVFEQISPETDDRWGVWAVSFPLPMSSHENVASNLAANISLLTEKWQAWRKQRGLSEAD
jgi:hypothetical protein